MVGKMEDGVTIDECNGLYPKMYSLLLDDSSEHKKVKVLNKNVVWTIRRKMFGINLTFY